MIRLFAAFLALAALAAQPTSAATPARLVAMVIGTLPTFTTDALWGRLWFCHLTLGVWWCGLLASWLSSSCRLLPASISFTLLESVIGDWSWRRDRTRIDGREACHVDGMSRNGLSSDSVNAGVLQVTARSTD